MGETVKKQTGVQFIKKEKENAQEDKINAIENRIK